MTSYEFEIAAKNAVIDLCKKRFNEDYDIFGIDLLHMSTTKLSKKCAMMDMGSHDRIYIVTLDGDKMNVDIYVKDTYKEIEDPDTKLHLSSSLLLNIDD